MITVKRFLFAGDAITWIRTHYDRVALLIGIFSFAGSALLIVRDTFQLKSSFPVPSTLRPSPARAPSAMAELAEAVTMLECPARWNPDDGSGLFVPEKHFIGMDGFPTTLHATQVHPPVPNEWLEKFDLPINDGDVLHQDPDEDGFSNLEEWEHQTNPTDGRSHPSVVTKLKLKSLGQEPFRLVFSSRINESFAINTNDLKEPTQFLKLGDSIRGTQFRLIKFREKFETNGLGTRVDASELVLENRETREEIALVKEKLMNSPQIIAHFLYSWNGYREFAMGKEGSFSLKPEEKIKYRVIDLQPSKAIIINMQEPDELIEITLLNP